MGDAALRFERWACAIALAAAGTACASRDSPTAAAGGSNGPLRAVSGDSQAATLGATLASPLVVQVTGASGGPVSGATVTWRVNGGTGRLSATTTATDTAGHASVLWTIDSTFLRSTVTATVGTDSATFVALGNGSGDLRGRAFFPSDNAWNTNIASAPVDPNSATLIASCGASAPLHPDFGTVYNGAPNGIPYVVVRDTQSRVPVTFQYASESDPGPYPVPPYAPIEGGPSSTGDRHVLVVDVDSWILYEMWDAQPVNGGASWTAGSGAIFNLNSDSLRPAGWTSADAAGLPILPGLVRYDEVAVHGAITHALRFTCPSTREAYVPPARHYASSDTSSALPPMGMRVRLKASVDISGYSANVQVILRALQQYGMFVADNGSPFYLSGAPDPRWSDDDLHTMTQLEGSDFEVVEMQGIVTP